MKFASHFSQLCTPLKLPAPLGEENTRFSVSALPAFSTSTSEKSHGGR